MAPQSGYQNALRAFSTAVNIGRLLICSPTALSIQCLGVRFPIEKILSTSSAKSLSCNIIFQLKHYQSAVWIIGKIQRRLDHVGIYGQKRYIPLTEYFSKKFIPNINSNAGNCFLKLLWVASGFSYIHFHTFISTSDTPIISKLFQKKSSTSRCSLQGSPSSKPSSSRSLAWNMKCKRLGKCGIRECRLQNNCQPYEH
jgi:hypothetical protein